MNQKQEILKFVNHISNNNLKQANIALASIVNEKIKNRIAIANSKLSSK